MRQHSGIFQVLKSVFRGYHGDLNETIFVGEVSEKAKNLVVNTWECLEKAITECVKPGTKYREVGWLELLLIYFTLKKTSRLEM